MGFHVRVTADGWRFAKTFSKRTTESKKVFIAIRFNSGDTSTCIKEISEGINEAGFEPICLAEESFSDPIMTKALLEIQNSRFIVCDVTENRTAVAFEAGFAMAKGKDIIFLCRMDFQNELQNFYAKHYQLLFYNSEADLKELVKSTIALRYGTAL